MPKKVYRPKAEASELREVTFPTSDGYRTVRTFPYETSDVEEQDFLDAHPLVTDRPAPKSGGGDGETSSLTKMTKAALEERFAAAGGDPSGMNKAQLVEAIREAESRGEGEADGSASDSEEVS